MKRILHLSVKSEYFLEVRDKVKAHEYRLQTEYWRKRLEGKQYDEVHIKLGYPKSSDADRIEIRPWKGYLESTITHKHFGDQPVSVYAIIVN